MFSRVSELSEGLPTLGLPLRRGGLYCGPSISGNCPSLLFNRVSCRVLRFHLKADASTPQVAKFSDVNCKLNPQLLTLNRKTLNPKPSTLHPKTLNPKISTLNPKTLNPKPSTLNPKTPSPKPSTLNPKTPSPKPSL